MPLVDSVLGRLAIGPFVAKSLRDLVTIGVELTLGEPDCSLAPLDISAKIVRLVAPSVSKSFRDLPTIGDGVLIVGYKLTTY